VTFKACKAFFFFVFMHQQEGPMPQEAQDRRINGFLKEND
jgi:hypothetical protein